MKCEYFFIILSRDQAVISCFDHDYLDLSGLYHLSLIYNYIFYITSSQGVTIILLF